MNLSVHSLIQRHKPYVIGLLIAFMCLILSSILIQPVSAFAADTGTTTDYTYSADPRKYTWVQLDTNTFTMDTDKDGKPDITLVKNGDTWTYTFDVEDASRNYYVYEEMFNGLQNQGYTSSGSDGTAALPNDPGQTGEGTKTYTITNTKAHTEMKTGSLKVSKTVSSTNSNALNRKFAFTITLSATDSNAQKAITGQKIFGGVPFVNGVATISLGNGESSVMTDIPAGVTYTVVETAVTGYTSKATGDTGTITADTTSEASFANTYNSNDAVSKLSLTIAKKVEGSPQSDSDIYTAHVLFSQASAGTILSLSNGTRVTVGDDGTADCAIQLKKDSSVTIDNIPVGTHYIITEDGGSWYAKYKITDANAGSDNGTIVSDSGSVQSINTALSTSEETADANEAVTVTFTNTIHKVQTLTLKKVVKDALGAVLSSDNDKNGNPVKYTIELMMSGLPANESLPSSIGTLNADANGEIDMLLYLQNNDTITISDVPVGTYYRFIEQPNDKIGQYAITVADGQTGSFVKQTNKNAATNTLIGTGNVSGTVGKGDEVVDEHEDATVTFTNSLPLTFTLPFTGSAQVIGVIISIIAAVILITYVAMRQARNLHDGSNA